MKRAVKVMGLLAAAALGGCSTVTELAQPEMIPVFVQSYTGSLLSAKTKELPCVLNVFNCAENATVVQVNLSGSREPGPLFPIRQIVLNEFSSVVDSNFRKSVLAEQARVELKVESRRVLLERDGSDLKCDMELAVMLLNPKHTDKPYFSRTYREKTYGKRRDKTTVPNCVYEAVQKIAQRFVSDVNGDLPLVERLSQLQD